MKLPDIDFATVHDPNRWQPLALDVMIGQNGVPLPGKIQLFVGAQWGDVTPFALTRANPTDLYLDPGPPPLLGGAGDADFKAQARRSSSGAASSTADDPTLIDISPATLRQQSARHQRRHGPSARIP